VSLSLDSRSDQPAPSLAQQRKELARDLLHLGTAAILKAQSIPEEAIPALTEACGYLMESIRYNRSDPDAFTGMGYLLWLVGENRDAESFLEEALLLSPEHSDAQKIKALLPPPFIPIETILSPESNDAEQEETEENEQYLSATPDWDGPEVSLKPPKRPLERPKPRFKSRPPNFDKSGPKLIPVVVVDYDKLYDQLERRIQKEVRKLSIFHPDWYASSRDRYKVEKVEKQYISLRESQVQFLQKIEEIENEIDCSALREMLKPLDIIVARCEHSLNLSWQMIQLQEMLDGHHRWMERELLQFEASGQLPAEFSEQRFDYLLSDCDALADQLDQLESLGLDCSRLVSAYERLAIKVSRFQDLRSECI
jgi:tetratricopeptide (TPR) repeat protein